MIVGLSPIQSLLTGCRGHTQHWAAVLNDHAGSRFYRLAIVERCRRHVRAQIIVICSGEMLMSFNRYSQKPRGRVRGVGQ
jgi:hypothetical protein